MGLNLIDLHIHKNLLEMIGIRPAVISKERMNLWLLGLCRDPLQEHLLG